MSTNLLHSSAIIDQVFTTRRLTAEAVAQQFYGCFITTEKCSDLWLKKGIAAYLAGLFVKKTFGNNEYRHMVHEQMQRVVRYSRKWFHSSAGKNESYFCHLRWSMRRSTAASSSTPASRRAVVRPLEVRTRNP